MSEESEVAKFYKGQNVLITGTSGFMGKVLIWKLLFSCPDIERIYILIRSKRGKSIELRRDEILKAPIFDKFWDENPNILEKIVPIQGDVGNENLDLSEEDEQIIIDNVSIVFHIAATINLDANLKDTINTNTAGTYRLLQICCKFKKLIAFVHTSTAYCHCEVQTLEERVYPSPRDPHNLINLARWMDRNLIKDITQKIISPHPNTYTYSKRLAEKVVAEHYPLLPVAIARPSNVTPGWKEPVPGWVDNLNGIAGFMVACGKGVMVSSLGNPDQNVEFIPVDTAINALITIAWQVATEKQKSLEIPVFNLSQSDMKPINWREITDLGKEVNYEVPFEKTLWLCRSEMRNNKVVHYILVILFQWIPAYLIDFIMPLIGQKRFMVRVQQRIQHGLRVVRYFTMHQWNFQNSRFVALQESMNSKDKEIFNMSLELINMRNYLIDCSLGIRLYCLKEDPASLPRCRRNLKILYVLDRSLNVMFYLFLIWIAYRFLNFGFDFFKLTSPRRYVHYAN